jgi:hypothetical protein
MTHKLVYCQDVIARETSSGHSTHHQGQRKLIYCKRVLRCVNIENEDNL